MIAEDISFSYLSNTYFAGFSVTDTVSVSLCLFINLLMVYCPTYSNPTELKKVNFLE